MLKYFLLIKKNKENPRYTNGGIQRQVFQLPYEMSLEYN